MTPETGTSGGQPPWAKDAEQTIEWFIGAACEHYDSVLVLVVGTPEGPEQYTHFVTRMSGNPYATRALRDAWMDGRLPEGRWLAIPNGPAVPVADDMDEWVDGSGLALEGISKAMAERLLESMDGVLVLATCGAGPEGTTKTWAMAYGNSLACAGAMATWVGSDDG